MFINFSIRFWLTHSMEFHPLGSRKLKESICPPWMNSAFVAYRFHSSYLYCSQKRHHWLTRFRILTKDLLTEFNFWLYFLNVEYVYYNNASLLKQKKTIISFILLFFQNGALHENGFFLSSQIRPRKRIQD